MSNPSPTAVGRAGFIPVLNPDAVPLFARLFLLKSSQALLSRCSGHRAWWSPSLTLMAMILGHLLGHASLDRVQEFMRCGVADGLCLKGKIISCFLNGCHNTAGLAMARARLTLTWMRKMLTAQSRELQGMVGGFQWHGMSVMLVDGSMATMRSLGGIPRCFPPHSNQHGSTYWCQMRVLFVMCLGTGLILHLVMGSAADSEQAQLVRLMLFGSEGSPSLGPVLWMGDANFGIWRVAAAAQQTKQKVLLRLTGPRAKKLAGRHALVPGLDLEVSWEASANDQIDRGLKPQIIKGRLLATRLERNGFRPVEIYFFTTVPSSEAPANELCALYLRRWNIELNLRNYKTQLGLGEIRAKSPAMAKRELYSGAMAYNLVRGAMLLASAKHGVPLGEISFSKARVMLVGAWIEGIKKGAAAGEPRRLERALRRIAKGKLPKRKKPRLNSSAATSWNRPCPSTTCLSSCWCSPTSAFPRNTSIACCSTAYLAPSFSVRSSSHWEVCCSAIPGH